MAAGDWAQYYITWNTYGLDVRCHSAIWSLVYQMPCQGGGHYRLRWWSSFYTRPSIWQKERLPS